MERGLALVLPLFLGLLQQGRGVQGRGSARGGDSEEGAEVEGLCDPYGEVQGR